ncbi:aromatic hydrocarbon degradation protein [Shewanella canadensis]|uniref:Aromatic hydrocarbon degradation protein n=2 Tax=Shewanella canadensis TaxID=271096 RepID=A0A3S0KWC3_9GAMM|nr:aromatic hydrocarbon degradation protein [Shewanella canadensis]
MREMSRLKKTVIIGATILFSQQAYCAGFQLNAQSNAGLGRAFAGDAVIADNASSMARNPATMALFKEAALSAGFISITSMVEVKDAVYTRDLYSQGALVDSSAQSANYDDAGDNAIAPNIHFIMPINDQFAWGINAYSNFGTKTEYSEDYIAGEYGGMSEVKSYNLGLSGSYRMNEHFSIGAGLDIIASTGKLKRSLQPTNTNLLTVDAKGWGVGFNLGAVYELDDNNRFGLSYRYSPEMETEGDVDYAGYLAESGPIDDTVLIPLPNMAEFSGFHHLENTNIALHYSIQWIGWSAFESLEAETSGTLNSYEWKDGWHYAIGATYYLNNAWTLRAGYLYDTSAQDKLTSISVPDSNRQFFSTGFTYQLTPDSGLDFGFTYVLGEDVSVVESKPMIPIDIASGTYLATNLTATSHANAMMVGLQYNRTF